MPMWFEGVRGVCATYPAPKDEGFAVVSWSLHA